MASASVSKSDSACNVVPVLALINGVPRATSLQVAEHFAKRHDNVLQSIERLEIPDDFRLLNFQETVVTRPNPSGGAPIQSPAISMTRDGFTILVMGFTGKRAMDWKLRYMEAFNSMEQALRQPEQAALPPSTAQDRKPLRDIVHAWTRVAGLDHQTAWSQVRAHFSLARIDHLPAAWIPDAIAFVQARIDALAGQKALPAGEALPAVQGLSASRRLSKIHERMSAELHGVRERIVGHLDEIKAVYGERIWVGQLGKSPLNEARWAAYLAAYEQVDALMNMARTATRTLHMLYGLERAAEDFESKARP